MNNDHSNKVLFLFIILSLLTLNIFAIKTKTEIKEIETEIVACDERIAEIEKQSIEIVKSNDYKLNKIQDAILIKPTYIINITDEEVEMLYYAVANEVGADYLTDESRKLVASVIINRVISENFPNTITEVLSAQHQFTEAYENYYTQEHEPSFEVKSCVNSVLINGTTTNATYYYAPKYTKWKYSNWFENELQFVYECDGQRFFVDKINNNEEDSN